jgi:hypothetical protein
MAEKSSLHEEIQEAIRRMRALSKEEKRKVVRGELPLFPENQ